MGEFLGISIADDIGMNATLCIAHLCADGQPHIPMPFKVDPASGGNEVQHLLRLARKMRRYRPRHAIIDDERQIPHARRREEHRPHIAARHINGHGCSRNRCSKKQQSKEHSPDDPSLHPIYSLVSVMTPCAVRSVAVRSVSASRV